MIHLKRDQAPDFWTRDRVKKWTKAWLARGCESGRWFWPQYDGRKVNEYVCEALKPWHYEKCAFCECQLSEHEIEHFRSKTGYPLAAFIWRNLFLICGACNQAKGSNTHERCLKPDRDNPEDYLSVNYTTLKIEPKLGISDEMYQIALNTIERYKLDRPELTQLYIVHLRVAFGGKLISPADVSFRMNLKQLRGLAQPDLPFSQMIKSLLQYFDTQT